MAELFGVAAGVVGFVSLFMQIDSTVRSFNEFRQNVDGFPFEMDELIRELGFLSGLMKEVQEKQPANDDVILQHCQSGCGQVVRELEALRAKLEEKLPKTQHRGKRQRIQTLFVLRHWKNDVENLQRSIQGAKINLILVMSRQTATWAEDMALVNHLHMASIPTTEPSEKMGHLCTSVPSGPSPNSPPEKISTSSIKRLSPKLGPVSGQPFASQPRPRCNTGACPCSCHNTSQIYRRFWALEYTPWAASNRGCNYALCSSASYGISLKLPLVQFGLRWSVAFQLWVTRSSSSVSLRPGLNMERMVPGNSPGFKLLQDYTSNIISLEETHAGLVELYRSDPTFTDHVGPEGQSYMDYLVWAEAENESLFKLLYDEFGIKKEPIQGYLTHCLYEQGSIELLLGYGVDMSDFRHPSVENWRLALKIFGKHEIDPLLLNFQQLVFTNAPMPTSVPPLHEAILCGAHQYIEKLSTQISMTERNFLGQTALHLAVETPEILLTLLKRDPSQLNSRDEYGRTPLMFTSMVGQEQSMEYLIDAGADLGLDHRPPRRLALEQDDQQAPRNFLEAAAVSGKWSFLVTALEKLESRMNDIYLQSWTQAILSWIVQYPHGELKPVIERLLSRCESVDFTFDDIYTATTNSTLLHHVQSTEFVDALISRGFSMFSHVNSLGQNALAVVALRTMDPTTYVDLMRKLIELGLDLEQKDSSSRTAIHRALGYLTDASQCASIPTFKTIYTLLRHGADPLSRDNCDCPCSSSGCLPCPRSAVDGRGVWSMEALRLIMEHRGQSAAKEYILHLIRRATFDDLGMTHLCCARARGGHGGHTLGDNDRAEIMEEEADFIEMLNTEMLAISQWSHEELLGYWARCVKANICRGDPYEEKRTRHQWEIQIEWYVIYLRDAYREGTYEWANDNERYDWYKGRVTYLYYYMRGLGMRVNLDDLGLLSERDLRRDIGQSTGGRGGRRMDNRSI